MNFELLHQILITVKQENTISDVANKIYLSQPYVSQVIARAENKYGVTLVNRKQNPISLTLAGQKLADDLNEEIKIHEKTVQDLKQFSKFNLPKIRIAITPIWIPQLTTKIIKKLQQDFPHIDFEIVRYFTAGDTLKMLKNNNIDLFWGALLHEKSIISKYLYRSQACIIIPANNPNYNLQKHQLKYSAELLDKLNNSNFVSLENDSIFQHIVDHFFTDDGLNMNKVIYTNDFVGAASMTIAGLGITVTLKDALAYLPFSKNNFNVVNLPENLINLDVGLSYNTQSSKLVQKIAAKMFNYITNVDSTLRQKIF